MNVLLAEAQVPYEQLKEMDDINGDFKDADVVLVVGANDVVNPAAKTTPGAPIYGMPILNADEAKQVVFMKRSMRPGFAGIENELLFEENTTLLFGDAKDSMGKLLNAVKASNHRSCARAPRGKGPTSSTRPGGLWIERTRERVQSATLTGHGRGVARTRLRQQAGMLSQSQLTRAAGFAGRGAQASSGTPLGRSARPTSFSTTTGPLSWDQRLWFAVLHAGPTAMIGGLDCGQGARAQELGARRHHGRRSTTSSPSSRSRACSSSRSRRPLADMRAPW